MYMRRLYGTTSTTVDSQSPASERSAESNSSEGDKSGKSNQSQDAGKPVRGGVWLPLALMGFLYTFIVFFLRFERIELIDLLSTAGFMVEFSFAGCHWSGIGFLLRQGKETSY